MSASDWSFYKINTTELGFDADYPGNLGYNHDALVFTLNMLGGNSGNHVQIVSVNAADLMTENAADSTLGTSSKQESGELLPTRRAI